MNTKNCYKKLFETPDIWVLNLDERLTTKSIIKVIDNSNFFKGEIVFVVGPEQWLDLFKIENFEKYSVSINDTERTWLGIRWILCHNLPFDGNKRKTIFYREKSITQSKDENGEYVYTIINKDEVLFVYFRENY